MKNKLKEWLQTIRRDSYYIIRDIVIILLSGFIVAIGSAIIIDTYYRYLDKTEYYQIISPAKTEFQDYKNCEKVGVILNRRTLLETEDATDNIQLYLIQSGTDRIVSTFKLDTLIPETKGLFIETIKDLQLPCDLVNGEYYFKGVVTYKVRGYEHNEVWFTDSFNIKN